MTNYIYRAAKHQGAYSNQDFSDLLAIDKNRRVNAKLYPALWALQQRYRYCMYCYRQAWEHRFSDDPYLLTELALPFDIQSFDDWPISNFWDPMLLFKLSDAYNQRSLMNFIDLNNYLKTLASYLVGVNRHCNKHVDQYNQYVLEVQFLYSKDPKCCRGLDQICKLKDAARDIAMNKKP